MVYATTNAYECNEFIAFKRNVDGTLTHKDVHAYETGGSGTGAMKVAPVTLQDGIDPLTSQGSFAYPLTATFCSLSTPVATVSAAFRLMTTADLP